MANLTLRSTKGAPLTHDELDGNFEYFTGSINTINASTGSFLTSADTGSFVSSEDTGSFVTSNETGSFLTTSQTASLNISDTLYTVNAALSASTTSSATTSVCSYGVNMFEYVTPTNFATKLPQPTTGKSVRIVNNGNTFLKVFPSNVGGRINNYPIDTPAIIPSDGNLYEFICIENPLPGEWTFSAPATGQYDSGDITISIASSIDGDNPWVTAIDSTKYGMIDSSFIGTWAYDGKNKPPQPVGSSFNIGGSNPYYAALIFRPDTAWKGISKIKVYTNLLSGSNEVRLQGAGEYGKYEIATGNLVSYGGGALHTLFDLYVDEKISGTAITGSTRYTSANIGDPGTMWGEKVAYSDQYDSDVSLGTNVEGTFIGNKFIENTTRNDVPVEKYYSSYISFQMWPLSYRNYGTIPDFKFRFIIEYYQ
jgi:hypothetical protein